jgi:UDP-glucose 4-epimerase
MSSVLVTGGAGFIGSHVADSLIRLGHAVTVFDDLSGGFEENVPAGARFVRGSVTDHMAVDRLFSSARFEYVYHLAAYAAEGLSHFIRRFNYANNVIGSVNLINASVNHGVRGFIFTSSIAVYGSSAQLPVTEETPLRPEDPYGIAKAAVEADLRACRETFGLDFMVFRPHNVYGPRQNVGDRYRNVIGIFMNQILRGEPMTIFGDGTQTRAFTYIDDVAPVLAEALGNGRAWNRVFNIGADRPTSLADLARQVAASMDVPPLIAHVPARHEVKHVYAAHDALAEVFGPRQETPLADGLRRMAGWVRERGARASAPFQGIEIAAGLPPVWAT